MRLGFTGTREMPTGIQEDVLIDYLNEHDPHLVRHGACRGADAMMHRVALWWETIDIYVHPPIKTHNMMAPDWNHPQVTVLPHKEYHPRNRDIVDGCDRLLVMPNGPWRPNSGTWYTHDYGVSHGKPIDIIWPDGRLKTKE